MTCPHQDWKFESVAGQIVKVCIKCGEVIPGSSSITVLNRPDEEMAEWMGNIERFEGKMIDGVLHMLPIRKE